MTWQPRIAITMGDAAGIGPEVIVRACADPRVREYCRPLVIGHPQVLRRAIELCGIDLTVAVVERIDVNETGRGIIACFNPVDDDVLAVSPGCVDARAGRAAFECLAAAANAALSGEIDALTTAPLNKSALHCAGFDYPGHTEILADVCKVKDFAMMLYLPPSPKSVAPCGLGVGHATLHTAIKNVPELLTADGIASTTALVARFMKDMGCRAPRVAVCALNPHAGEQGLFGDEEQRIIAPAVEASRRTGIDAAGPLPADTLLMRATAGEFDGVVAMYHDQGHIALKLIEFQRAVNVTLGLPIVRTSPSHGTAYDIVWSGTARPDGMVEAIRVASLLARQPRENNLPTV